MKVTSTNFDDGDYLRAEHILAAEYGFDCAGGNRSPQLRWEDAPAGTRTFAVTCYDRMRPPTAASGTGSWPTSPPT